MPNFISEDDIEQAMVQRLQHLYGYDVLDCLTSDPADVQDVSGCGTRGVLFHAFSSKCMKQDPTPSTRATAVIPGGR